MAFESLKDVLLDQLKDLLNAEKQLVKALPKMARAANDAELKAALEEHLEVTRNQVERMEEVFAAIGQPAKGKKCEGMEGLIAEGDEALEHKKDSNPASLDAAIIAAAQRVEHYEIAGYGSARTFAEVLGYEVAAGLLQKILDEESEANEKLTEIAETVNAAAAEEGMEDEDEADSNEEEKEELTTSGAGSGRRRSNGRRSR